MKSLDQTSVLLSVEMAFLLLFVKKKILPKYPLNWFSIYAFVSVCIFVPYPLIWAYPFLRDLRVAQWKQYNFLTKKDS
jgi:hypothetical protein